MSRASYSRFPERNAVIKELMSEGEHVEDVAEFFGLSVGRVYQIAPRARVVLTPEGRLARDKGILRRAIAGETNQEIGKYYKMSPRRVALIVIHQQNGGQG